MKRKVLAQAMFKPRLFLLRIFFVQVCARGDPEKDHCHDYDRRREQADLFRDGHAMPFLLRLPPRGEALVPMRRLGAPANLVA
jgi:hypothetical protein